MAQLELIWGWSHDTARLDSKLIQSNMCTHLDQFGDALGPVWGCLWPSVGMPWVRCGDALGLVWGCLGSSVGMPWVQCGDALGPVWGCLGSSVGMPWAQC